MPYHERKQSRVSIGRRCRYFVALGSDPDSDLAEMAIAAVSRKRERSELELAGAVRRLVKAMTLKAMDGDPEFLAEMRNLHDYVGWSIDQVVAELRQGGHTWQSIGEATGTTRQAALMKWGPRIATRGPTAGR